MRTAVAGTFGPLHDGHRAMLRKALVHGDHGVVIGISSDEFARESRRPNPRPVPPFSDRKDQIAAAVADLDEWDRDVELREFSDTYGFADDDPALDALVVSPETDDELDEINRRRRKRGLNPLVPLVVPHVTAEDGKPISSTRIVSGEINEHGTLLD